MSKLTLIEIKDKWYGAVIFSGQYVDIKDAAVAAVNTGADLRGADLRGANLYGTNLRDANLRGADLYGADLRGANLYGTNLRGANLRDANLRGANLYGTNLRDANLYGADLGSANLRGADLYGADLRDANLYGADLRDANLRGANLYGTNLRGAKGLLGFLPEGQFCGWKKVLTDKYYHGLILKLLIPENAHRLNFLGGRKCRASYVIPIEAYTWEREKITDCSTFKAMHDGSEYELGVPYYPDKYDDDARVECSNGVHFFITFEEALEY